MAENRPWNLESFVDALVVELDKTRETLAVKAINKPLSYTVKDMNLDLQLFPSYDGDQIQFITAKPGEEGASKVSIQLSSITDQQVRATSKRPTGKDDIKIDNIEVDDETKKTLRKFGVTSVKDLEEFEKKNVDLEKVSPRKINYSNLANIIRKTKRNAAPPSVKRVSLSMSDGKPVLVVEGENLAIQEDFQPVAVVNNQLAEVLKSSQKTMEIALKNEHLSKDNNELIVTLDPFSVFKLNLKK